MRAKSVIFFSLFLSLLIYPAMATSMEEAVDISKNTDEVKDLLEENPDAFVIAREDTYGENTCWEVDWWTFDRVENKLHYPNVVVWVDKESGDILNVGIPRGGEHPVPVLTPDYINKFWWIVTVGVIVAALVASVIFIYKPIFTFEILSFSE